MTESANLKSTASPRAPDFVGAVGVSPAEGVSRKSGVPIGSAWSRSDEISAAGTGEAAGAGVAAVDEVGRGRGTRDGVSTLRADGRGAPPGLNPLSTAGVYHRFSVAVRRRVVDDRGAGVPARQRRAQSNRWSRRSPSPV